jgi:hypothetical protein
MKFMIGSRDEELKAALKKAMTAYLERGMLDDLEEDIYIVMHEEWCCLQDKAEIYSKAAKRFQREKPRKNS